MARRAAGPIKAEESWYSKIAFWQSPYWDTFNDWIFRPFVQGLAFGVAQHGSKYLVARIFHRPEPEMPAVPNPPIYPVSNSTAAAGAGSAAAPPPPPPPPAQK